MSRLPTVGSDNNDWGNVLNDYLSVSLDTDGTIKKASIEESLTGDITSHDHSMVSTTFVTSILLDKQNGRDYGTVDVTTNNAITLDATNIKNGASAQIGLRGDGSHTPVLTDFNKYDANGVDYDNTLNMLNSFSFFRWLNKNYYNIIDQYSSSGSTTLSAPTVTASVLSTTSLRFSWTNITNNSGYRYKISTDSGSTYGTPVDLATNIVTFDITGLSVGTRRDVQVLVIGNGTTYLNSAYSTVSYATTSSLTQLTTPTINAPTVISSTEIDLTWSTVANVTSWKLEWSPNGTDTWTQIGGTITGATLLYNHTSLTPATAYYYRLTAVGDQVTYSDSATSVVVNATTKTAAPTLVSSATSTDGLTITHTFSRAMAASPTTTGYSTSPVKIISSATRNADTTKIDVVVSVAFLSTDTITATIPAWLPADGGDAYAGVSGVAVTNNVVAVGETNLTFVNYNYNYNNIGGTDYRVGPANGFGRLMSDQTFNGNFEVIIDLTDSYYFSGGYFIEFGIDLSTNTSNSGSYNSWIAGIGFSTASSAQTYINGVVSPAYTYAANDRWSYKRVGTTLTLNRYSSGSWTVVSTLTGTFSQTVRFNANGYGDGTHKIKLNNPKYI